MACPSCLIALHGVDTNPQPRDYSMYALFALGMLGGFYLYRRWVK